MSQKLAHEFVQKSAILLCSVKFFSKLQVLLDEATTILLVVDSHEPDRNGDEGENSGENNPEPKEYVYLLVEHVNRKYTLRRHSVHMTDVFYEHSTESDSWKHHGLLPVLASDDVAGDVESEEGVVLAETEEPLHQPHLSACVDEVKKLYDQVGHDEPRPKSLGDEEEGAEAVYPAATPRENSRAVIPVLEEHHLEGGGDVEYHRSTTLLISSVSSLVGGRHEVVEVSACAVVGDHLPD